METEFGIEARLWTVGGCDLRGVAKAKNNAYSYKEWSLLAI